MPLVILCGFPCSGKSSRAQELLKFLNENFTEKFVVLVSDHTLGVNRNNVFADSTKEKHHRAVLKSEVQRHVNRDTVVILDSVNYIKGFRYELYCTSKAAQTPHCVIHCDTNEKLVRNWNCARCEEERYHPEIQDSLIMRFEPPDSRSRWDSPLFTVHEGDKLQCEQICNAIFNKKPPPPNMATQSQPLSATNFMYELDKVTQDIMRAILEAQKTSFIGDDITVPGTEQRFELVKTLTMIQLRSLRKQFISYSKTHPIEINRIATSFVQYLNNSIK